jgi:hypothetical protein
VSEEIAPLLHYTGYVDEGVEPAGAPAGERSGIVVSGGSSAAGLPLYGAALEAARAVPEQPWRVLVGAGVPQEEFEALRRAAPGHAAVERARPDFRALLAGAALSVSQAGYNTAVDLLRARVPTVLVPFEAGHETEQRLRAECLARLGVARVLPEAELSADALAAQVRAALAQPHGPRPDVDLDGAAATVALIGRLARPASPPRRATYDWSHLDEALRRAADAGVTVPVWWRDDDAIAHTPALDRLLGLAGRFGVPLALAAIPGRIEPSLPRRVADESGAVVLVHGWAHANHAGPGEKKAEFGAGRPLEALAGEAAAGLEAARAALGGRLLPVLVPPWNRVAPDLVGGLAALGYRGLSIFGPCPDPEPAPGLVQVNTHVDPVDWRGTRGLLPPDILTRQLAAAVSARAGHRRNADEPIGLLTHHLIHDEPLWGYCEALLERLARHANLRYPSPRALFDSRTARAKEL